MRGDFGLTGCFPRIDIDPRDKQAIAVRYTELIYNGHPSAA